MYDVFLINEFTYLLYGATMYGKGAQLLRQF